MAYVLDYTSERHDLDQMKRAGVVGIIRYLSTTAWKNITKSEYQAAIGAGLQVALVWETTGTMTDGGFAAGARDGGYAKAQATALGYPSNGILYWAVDHQPHGDLDTIEAYGRGFASTCGFHARPYGNDLVVDTMVARGVADAGWQCAAWSNHRAAQHAVLFQKAAGVVTQLPGGYDENNIIRGDWAVSGSSPTPPQPVPPANPGLQETQMITITNPDGTDEGFDVNAKGEIIHQWVNTDGSASAWVPLGDHAGFAKVGSAVVTPTAVFVTALGAFGGLFLIIRDVATNTWHPWATLSDWQHFTHQHA